MSLRKKVSWTEMKSIIDNKVDSSVQAILAEDHWDLSVSDGSLTLTTELSTDDVSDAVDLADFLSNYLPAANKLIDAKTLIGATDGTKIGNTLDRLRVESQQVQGGPGDDPADTPGCPTYSNKLRVEFDDVDITMVSTYTTIFNYQGSGKFSGFLLNFNSSSVFIKLTVDGNVVLEDKLSDLEEIFGGDSSSDDSSASSSLCGLTLGGSNRIKFCPKCPIAFNSEVKIEGKRSGSTDKTLQNQLVMLTQET